MNCLHISIGIRGARNARVDVDVEQPTSWDHLRCPEGREFPKPRSEHQEPCRTLLGEVGRYAFVPGEPGNADESRMVFGKDSFSSRRAHDGGTRAYRKRSDLC